MLWCVPGELDIHILKTMQSVLPSVHMSADAVEPSADLMKNFKGADHYTQLTIYYLCASFIEFKQSA